MPTTITDQLNQPGEHDITLHTAELCVIARRVPVNPDDPECEGLFTPTVRIAMQPLNRREAGILLASMFLQMTSMAEHTDRISDGHDGLPDDACRDALQEVLLTTQPDDPRDESGSVRLWTPGQ